MEKIDFRFYEFGGFRLDARRRTLTKNKLPVHLSGRLFDLLLVLVKNEGQILEHDELLDKVWAGIIVEQANLKKGISDLRRVLEDSDDDGIRFIKTVPRRGYSFVASVRAIPDEEVVFVRETTREIILEEIEETNAADENPVTEKPIFATTLEPKRLPAVKSSKPVFLQFAIFGTVGIIALLLALFIVKPYFSKPAPVQFAAENIRISRLTNDGKVIEGTAVSPDGNYFLYAATDKNGVSLWLRQILANSATRLTPPMPGSYWNFAIAPDNSYVFYILNNTAEPQKSGLYKIPLLGGEPQRIAENVGSLAVSPDGKGIILVKPATNTISVVNQTGENERVIATYPANYRIWDNRWTPDGTALLCALRKTVDEKNLYYIAELSLQDGRETIILPEQTERIIYGAVWLPDKSAMLVTVREPNADIRQIWQYFPASREWRRVTNDNNSYKNITLPRDGKTIISSQAARLAAVWLLDNASASGKTALPLKADSFRQITGGVSSFHTLNWLSDGRLFYAATENGKEAIFTMNTDGGNVRQITNGDDGIWLMPTLAGDGQHIGFLSSRAGAIQVWRIGADGKNLSQLTNLNLAINSARILRDNQTVIYQAQTKPGLWNLYKQTADGKTLQLTQADSGRFAISPDEKLLAVETTDENTRQDQVELHSLETGETIKSFNFSVYHQISFTPDNLNLAYDVIHNDISQIMLQPLEGGAAKALTDFRQDEIFSFGWSADGQKLAVIRGKQLTDAVLIKTP